MNQKNIEDIYPLSPMQQGMLFHSLYAPKSGMYVEQLSLELHGNLDIAAFKLAWQEVLNRHSVLRTAFVWENLEKPLQVVGRQVSLPWQQLDWRELSTVEQQQQLEALLEAEQKRAFELSKAPLMNLTLIQLAENGYEFIWSHHHLLLDGWSLPLIFKEVIAFYSAFCQGENLHLEKPRPYRDYIAWLQQQNLFEAEIFWREALKGFTAPTPLISICSDLAGKAEKQESEGGNLISEIKRNSTTKNWDEESYYEQQLRLSTEATATLQSLARKEQLTLNTIVQGAWALLLSRYSGEEDIVYGATVSGRPPMLTGAESMVGLFINTLPVRVWVDPLAFILPWLKQFQVQQVELRQYEYNPLVDIQGWSHVPRGVPLFESIVVFENYPVDPRAQQVDSNLEIGNFRTFGKTNYPLTVMVIPGSELLLKIKYVGDRFHSDTIERMLGHLETLLLNIANNPHQRLYDLPLLTAAERHQLLEEWNDTKKDYPLDLCIHQLFEMQVEHQPDAIAIVFENQYLTYRELNQRANQLAHYLQSLGVEPEVLVGICLERSLKMIIALLAILKAGAAYVPLDPAYPQERIAYILEDAQISVLLTQQHLMAQLPKHQAKAICLDRDWNNIAQEDQNNLVNKVTSENLAYVIYTSGSTGKPKGVQIQHSAVVNFLTSMRQTPGIIERDIFLSVTTITFDIAALELYLPLIVGARVVVASREVASDGVQLLAKLAESGATIMQATPATWRMLLEAGLSKMSLKILCGGEALPHNLSQQLLERCGSLWNLYGPTETTIWSAVYRVKREDGVAYVGSAIANTQIYILDKYLNPVPIGITGELYIAGDGLARSYFNRPELTAEKFIPNPFSSKPGSRLYKTGDLARYLPDGTIEFLGRIDFQVKIRGFRIELGEIEAVLSQHPEVLSVVVVAREDRPENKHLVAYAVSRQSSVIQTQDLYHFLRQKLPEYMVPSTFVLLETLPLTPNGKIDRKSLPIPARTQSESKGSFQTFRTPTEEILTGIWIQVLGIQSIGIRDNFFQLGGHSLLATQVISRIRKAFQLETPLRYLFEWPTIAELSQRIEAEIKAGQKLEIPPIVALPREGNLTLSFAQQRLWFANQLRPGNPAYNIPAAVRLFGSLNVKALEKSLNEVVKRHEALRTTFTTVDEQPIQQIAPSLSLKIPVIYLIKLPNCEQEVQKLALEEAQKPFALDKAPLLRVTLLQLAENDWVLLLTMHHIISDAWSIGLLVQEIATLYEAFSFGNSSPLPELSIQYAEFAVWQKQWLQGEVLETQLAYWKQQLANLPVLELPTDRPRPAIQTLRGAKESLVISKTTTEALKILSAKEGVTLFMTVLATFQILLHYRSAQDDIVIGTDVANRNHAETEGLIGFFINQLVLRSNLGGNPTFRELLGRVREITLGAYAHQDLPFEKLVEVFNPKRDLNRTPLFQVKLVLQNVPIPPIELSGITLQPQEIESGMTKFDLTLFILETEQGLMAVLEYDADLFNPSTINGMLVHFEKLFSSIIAQPNSRINELIEILAQADKQQQLRDEKELAEVSLQKFKKFVTRSNKGSTMNNSDLETFSFQKLKNLKRKPVSYPQDELIETDYLHPGLTLPLVVRPAVNDVDLVDWIAGNREFIETKFHEHGAILFRGFNIDTAPAFERLGLAICSELFNENGEHPRETVSGNVYTPVFYPAEQKLLWHNENSFNYRWPMKIFFCCRQPAQQGGETPIVDSRKVLQLIDFKIREKFIEKKVMYLRNYGDGLGLNWKTVFQTESRSEVEAICKQAGVEFEWKSGNRLRTRSVRPAVVKHPKTGEMSWFNQAQHWHPACLDSKTRESLLTLFSEEDLPRNCYYGDGTPIEDSVIDEICQVYQKLEVCFPWQQGDVLVLDNILAAHARNPYLGERKLLVAMGELTNFDEV